MDLLLNDLSLHGQFPDLTSFRTAVIRVMLLRKLARHYGRHLYSHRNIPNCRISPEMSLHEALQRLPRDEKRSILTWLNRQGPFWEDKARHSPDLFIFCGDEIVTETAVGEAAYCREVGIDSGLISFEPSGWQISPVLVTIGLDSGTRVPVPNYWRMPELETALQEALPPILSWSQLEERSRSIYRGIAFSASCFDHLQGQPFAPGAATRILGLLDILNRLISSVDASGKRTSEGHQLYQDHFTGDTALFSDSSESEKQEFERKLTFPGPHGTRLFCPWHGKVNNPPFRIHFRWPEPPDNPLFVAYVGLKRTRR